MKLTSDMGQAWRWLDYRRLDSMIKSWRVGPPGIEHWEDPNRYEDSIWLCFEVIISKQYSIFNGLVGMKIQFSCVMLCLS